MLAVMCHIAVSNTVSARIPALALQLYERNKLKLKLKNIKFYSACILGITQ